MTIEIVKFRPTHIIKHQRRSIPVMETDGALYTRAEWRTCSTADWELVEDALFFQGEPMFNATLRQTENGK